MKKGMNVERSTVGTKKSRQPKRQKSLELVQSRQSLTTVRQEVLTYLFYDGHVTTEGYWCLRSPWRLCMQKIIFLNFFFSHHINTNRFRNLLCITSLKKLLYEL